MKSPRLLLPALTMTLAMQVSATVWAASPGAGKGSEASESKADP